MISLYKDHAANERTYLAWVRTGVTLVALGFLVERFQIFLMEPNGSPQLSQQVFTATTALHGSIALIVVGMFAIIAATFRFFQIKKELDASETYTFKGTLLSLSLSLAIIALSIYLLIYLLQIAT
jgi:putative membrane protein